MKGEFTGWFDLNTGEINCYISYCCNNNEEELMKELNKDFKKWWKNEFENQKTQEQEKEEEKEEKESSGHFKRYEIKRCEVYVNPKKEKKITVIKQGRGYNE
jgi:hypothetical protein